MRCSSLLLAALVVGPPVAEPQTGDAARRSVTIGVVIDGPWERNEEVERIFETELEELLEGEFDVRFPDSARKVADWSVASVESALIALLEDDAVDVVLAMGIIASDRAFRMDNAGKPVIAPFIIDAEIQGAPRSGSGSGVRNVNYLTSSITLRRDLEMFQRLRPFRRLALLHGPALNDIPGVRERLQEVAAEFDVELTLVEVSDRAEPSLAAIPPETEAVFVNPLLQLEPGENAKIAQGLIDRKLPSFARLGRGAVERGLLMSLTEDLFDRRARRVALNVQRALLGEDPGEFSVDFVMREELVINMATARAVGVFPSFALETMAETIHDARPGAGQLLDLATVAEEAQEANRELAAFDRQVAATLQNIALASSELKPQVDFSFQASAIDADRAEATGLAQYLALPSIRVTQVLYADRAWANKLVQEELQRAIELDREALRLDVVRSAATTYLDVLRTLTRERIQQENLGLSRENLELSKVRESLGASGPAEVYRWEAQIAADQASVIEAAASRNLAEIELNRLLNRPLEAAFTTSEIGIDDPEFLVAQRAFLPYLSSREYFDVARDALAALGLEQSPELQAIDAALLAQQRSLLSANRAFYIPDVVFQGAIEQQFVGGAGGLGAFQSLGALFPDLELTPPNQTNWSLGVDVTLPLFTSGFRPALRRQDTELVSQLRRQREDVALRVEQRVRSGLHRVGASYAGIQLAADAAEASARNLDLVTDSYSQGTMTIIQLLDAQNAAVLSQEAAANAVYTFLIDMLEVERALGRFYFRAPAEVIAALVARIDQAYVERGRTPPAR